MRLLADESCDAPIWRALRTAGHDVLASVESSPGAADPVILAQAAAERRVLLTEDKDFGQLVHASRQASAGVILLRYPFAARQTLTVELVELVQIRAADFTGCFVVVQPGRVRLSTPTAPKEEPSPIPPGPLPPPPSVPPPSGPESKPGKLRRKKSKP